MEKRGDNSLSLKYSELFNIWICEKNKKKQNDAVYNVIISKIDLNNVSKKDLASLKQKVQTFCKNLSLRWHKARRKMNVFFQQNQNWLPRTFILQTKLYSPLSDSSSRGRPRKGYSEKSEISRRRDAENLAKSNCHETELLVRAAAVSANKQKQADMAVVLKATLASPDRPSMIRKVTFASDKVPIGFTADEALAYLLDNNFTKQQYLNTRHENKIRNADIYPLYKDVADSKIKCRPDCVEVSEEKAMVSIQALLTHTAKRIIMMQMEVLENSMTNNNNNLIKADLIVSYGFDGSSGYSNYKQRSVEPSTSTGSELCLFATTLTPLRLIDSSGNPLWNNRAPQSIRFCRPIKLEFIKETKETILQEDLMLKQQINDLKDLEIEIGEGKAIVINFKLFLTVIDGKVLSVLTDTKSSQACPICKATPKDFISITDFGSKKFHAKEDNLKYGLSPLHCWIRFFEFVLHAGYKCKVKKWQIRTEDDRKTISERKTQMQKLFWDKMGLLIDKPKTGGFGSTNDGNTSRRAFTDHDMFSEITGIDVNLIYSLKIILISICYLYPLDVEKFQAYCHNTARIIQTTYPWLPMTATVHKVLIHGKEIIEHTILPIGCFGEEAAESRNKHYKLDWLNHARKTSRKTNLMDVFNRALDMSDLIISSINIKKRSEQRSRLQLPREVLNMFASPEVPETLKVNTRRVKGEEESEDEEFSENIDYLVLSESYQRELDEINLDNEL